MNSAPSSITIAISPALSSLVPSADLLAGMERASEAYDSGVRGSAASGRAYATDISELTHWLEEQSLSLPISSPVLAAYLGHISQELAFTSISRRLSSIRKYHRLAGEADPSAHASVVYLLKGLRRQIARPPKQAPDFKLPQLRGVCKDFGRPGLSEQTAATDHNAIALSERELRDRAVLLLGFSGAYRRGELVSLNVGSVEWVNTGAILTLYASKTNQFGAKEQKAIFYASDPSCCPVACLRAYMDKRGGAPDDPLFLRLTRAGRLQVGHRLSAETVNNLLKAYFGADYSAHSLRASFVTIAKERGLDDQKIMQQTKHRSRAMIDRYTRAREIISSNAASELGL